jgi:signal transduction histidine kinase
LIVIAVSLVALALIVPYADRPWPRLVAFIPAGDTGLVFAYVITATLLIGQFVQLRAPSALLLSCGYIFASLIVIAHLLSDAQVLRRLHPQAANELTTSSLFALWHGIFPIFVAVYALLSRSKRDAPVRSKNLLPLIGLAVVATTGLTALAVAVSVSDVPRRLAAMRIDSGLAATTAIVTAVALAILYAKTRARRVLDLWLCVVLLAWMLDIVVGGLIGDAQNSFGWYAGRIYGIIAAGVIMAALLLETGSLYARLIHVLADMQLQSAALIESEAALRQAQKMEAIGQITGGVAHDFNNLLTVIIGSLDMLKQQHVADPRALRLTNYAMQAAVRGEKLTKQLLAFSRRQILNPELKDPNLLIREFDGLMRRALGETIRIVLDLEPGIGAIRVDPSQCESAILNLAVNARDAMDGVGTITIATRGLAEIQLGRRPESAAPGPYVMIAVSDTGIGMDADTVSRVFEPFFTTKPVGKGSGLGLSQVYGFVTASGGFVEIESAPGAGTVMRLYFPQLADLAPVAKPEASDPIPQADAGDVILVVEDDAGVLAIAVETLMELGYGVRTAGNAPEALDWLLADEKIDLLFSDIVMPEGMNGVELAIQARGIRPGLKILLTSGHAAQALSDPDTLPAGIYVIAKPYRLEDLAQKVRQLIAGD